MNFIGKVLNIKMQYQRKDTPLLCFGCLTTGYQHGTYWDKPNPNWPYSRLNKICNHGKYNCIRASISMMAYYYGGQLSQDRIAYYSEVERIQSLLKTSNIPIGNLGHQATSVTCGNETDDTLKWALNIKENMESYSEDQIPGFGQLFKWIYEEERPVMTLIIGHMNIMNGCGLCQYNRQWVHILDPKTGPRWEMYRKWKAEAKKIWVGPPREGIKARSDEPSIWVDLNGDGKRDPNEWTDSDGDGVLDFDEIFRFHTDPRKAEKEIKMKYRSLYRN